MNEMKSNIKKVVRTTHFWLIFIFLFFFIILFFIWPKITSISYDSSVVKIQQVLGTEDEKPEVKIVPLDTIAYDAKLISIANNPPQPVDKIKKVKQPDGTFLDVVVKAVPRVDIWPVKTVYPNAGALLPFNRIVAYYGNLYSKKMGVLGQYEEDEMIKHLDQEVKKWEIADPNTPVIPAFHYIAVVAQGSAGADGKYRARMPDSEIDKVLKIAEKVQSSIIFLDIQVGLSDLQTEVPKFEKYLKLPNVHLGIDAEFAMQKTGKKPGKVVGTLDASDVNFTAEYLAKIVKENNLTPKILIVHRYTEKMITNYKLIKPLPEVQIVMHMDGWGGKEHKKSTYDSFVRKQPVQFTGFKLFYKNDIWEKGTVMFEPSELLKLSPQPSYIQYQ